MLGVGVALGAVALGAILLAVGSVFVARAELQQAVDVAAATAATVPEGSGHARVRAIARAGGARDVEVEELDGGLKLRITTRADAPGVLGVADGSKITAERIVEMPFLAGAVSGWAGAGAGLYVGPLVRIDSALACPRVASAFLAMQADARAGGVSFTATSGYRTFAEQAALYASLGPRLAAPPGSSRHHAATDLDLAVGPAGSPAHRWLSAHGPPHGFHQLYSWEPWHWGYVAGC